MDFSSLKNMFMQYVNPNYNSEYEEDKFVPFNNNIYGNIDTSQQPMVQNDDGSVSTVRSKSFGIDGKEVLLPTVSPDGRIWTDQEALDNYFDTGKYLGSFNSIDEANRAALEIHNREADRVANNRNKTYWSNR